MAKRTETRAAAAAKKGPKSHAAGRAARPGSATPKSPVKIASSVISATTKDDAAKAKAVKATAAKTTAGKTTAASAPLGKVSAGKTSAGKSAKKPTSGKAHAERGVKTVNAKPAPAKATARVSASARKAKATGKVASKAKATKTAKTKTAKPKAPSRPRFLAAELGHPVDHEGEPIGAGSRAALADTELQRYTLQLWRQMQSRRGVNTHIPAMERAGVTIDQIWTAGVTDRLTTSSSPDEVKRYRQKLLFRANLLESILTETVDELQRLGTIDPTPPRAAAEPG